MFMEKRDDKPIMDIIEEGNLLLDMAIRPSKNLNMVVSHENGYYQFKDGGKFIEGPLPEEATVINGKKGFVRERSKPFKVIIKAVPYGLDGFKIFFYSLEYDFVARQSEWKLIDLIVVGNVLNNGDYNIRAINYWGTVDTSMTWILAKLIDFGVDIEMDLSAIVNSADQFSQDSFYQLFLEMYSFIVTDKSKLQFSDRIERTNFLKDKLKSISCSCDEFADTWYSLFAYIDIASQRNHKGIETIISDGYENLLYEILSYEALDSKFYKIEDISKGNPVVNIPEDDSKYLSSFKWAHKLLALDLIEILYPTIGKDGFREVIEKIDSMSIKNTKKSYLLLRELNKLIRTKLKRPKQIKSA